MINLSKTFCRKFAIDVLKLQNVPKLCEVKYRGFHVTKNRRHSEIYFTTSNYIHYTIGFMNWGNDFYAHVSSWRWNEDDDRETIDDYTMIYKFDWETGTVGQIVRDSRDRDREIEEIRRSLQAVGYMLHV